MNGIERQATVILGSGGARPCVAEFDVRTGQVTKLLELTRGESPYALARSADGRLLAVGTRRGQIRWIETDNGRVADPSGASDVHSQAAPILAVELINERQLAASDTKRHCCIWDRSASGEPRRLPTGDRIVCSLWRLDASTLIGFATTGEFLFWQLANGELIRTAQAPAPPKMSALVHLTYWPAAHALVVPARGGDLIYYALATENVHHINAHEGDFYAIALLGEQLVTVGMCDGWLKRWQVGSDVPVARVKAPRGIIAAAVVHRREPSILLIERAGLGTEFEIRATSLKRKRKIVGGDYRVARPLYFKERQALKARQNKNEADEIAAQVRERIASGRPGDLESDFARLEELGFAYYAFALRAQQAQRQEDRLGALKWFAALARELPNDDPNACEWLKQYADLLESVWLLDAARACLDRILSIGSDESTSKRALQLSTITELLATTAAIVAPTVPISLLIESAVVAGQSLNGRFLIKEFEPHTWRATSPPASIVRKYEQLRKESGTGPLPKAEYGPCSWISSAESEPKQIDLITFGRGLHNAIHGCVFGLKVVPAYGQTLTFPLTLFDTAEIRDESGSPSHRRAGETWKAIDDNPAVRVWCESVMAVVSRALSMLERKANAPQTL